MPLLYACDACGCDAFKIVIVEVAKEVHCRDCDARLGRIGETREKSPRADRALPLSKLATRVNAFVHT